MHYCLKYLSCKACPQQAPRNVIPSVAPLYKPPIVVAWPMDSVALLQSTSLWRAANKWNPDPGLLSNWTFEKLTCLLFEPCGWKQFSGFSRGALLLRVVLSEQRDFFEPAKSTDDGVSFSKATQYCRPNHTTPTPHSSRTQQCELLHQHFIRRLNKEKESY